MLPLTDPATIRSIEERSFNAWPALHTEHANGWLFRSSNGYTKRANSANAVAPTPPFPETFREAELFYAARELPLIFRISPLAGPEPDSHLDTLGFRSIDESLVMVATIPQISSPDDQVLIHAHPDELWRTGFARAHGTAPHNRPTHDLILASIKSPAAYAVLMKEGNPIAFGLAVLENETIGLFDVVTTPSHRRQGAARRLTTSLLSWGRANGAHHAYLQVTAENIAARSLYEKLGFSEAYRYHYRIAP